MPDPILEDVKDLLLAEKGEKKILEQIKRACERNEIIALSERDYVQKLVEQFLKKEPPIPEKKIEITTEFTNSTTKLPSEIETTTESQESQQSTTSLKLEPKKNNTRIKKIPIGIGAVVVAIIIVVSVVISGISDFSIDQTTKPTETTTTPSTSKLTLETDKSLYNKADIISISGTSKQSLGKVVTLSIENGEGIVIWSENVKIKDSGSYSTLAIAGGQGWDKDGSFTIKVEHGDLEKEISFNFRN